MSTIYEQEVSLAIKRSAWALFRHELTRINPATSKPYTPRKALSNVLKWIQGQKAQSNFKHLTPTERQVIGLVVEGMAQKQIALELGCTRSTVRFHLTQIRRKLNLSSTYQVVAVAVDQGWVNAPRMEN